MRSVEEGTIVFARTRAGLTRLSVEHVELCLEYMASLLATSMASMLTVLMRTERARSPSISLDELNTPRRVRLRDVTK